MLDPLFFLISKLNKSVSEAGKFEILRAILDYYTLNRNGRISLIFRNRFLNFVYLYPKKSGLSRKLKVFTLDIRIKQSGLQVSHSKVSSSGSVFLKVGKSFL